MNDTHIEVWTKQLLKGNRSFTSGKHGSGTSMRDTRTSRNLLFRKMQPCY